jgi:hypothetical protein
VKRLTALLFLVALLVSACAVGEPTTVTSISDDSATLNGTVRGNKLGPVEYWFRYGQTVEYGTTTSRRQVELTSDDKHPISQAIDGLTPETTYHWQVCVDDLQEAQRRDICSRDQTFTTRGTDTINGVATWYQEIDPSLPRRQEGQVLFDNVRSGPDGQHPAGRVHVIPFRDLAREGDAICVAVAGQGFTVVTQTFSISVAAPEPDGDRAWGFNEFPQSQPPPTTCSATNTPADPGRFPMRGDAFTAFPLAVRDSP